MSNKKILAWIDSVNNGKDVSVASRLKVIDPLTDSIVRNLALIDRIEYIWVGHERIQASNEIEILGKRRKPVTKPGHPTAIGLDLLLEPKLKSVQVYEIASSVKGYGTKILQAMLKSIEQDWKIVIVMDYSMGFWEVMSNRYKQVELF